MEKDEVLIKEGDDLDAIYVVEKGNIQVYSEVDGHEFIIDNLGPGSVIGHRSVFTEDNMVVEMRATMATFISQVEEDDINDTREEFAEFDKVLLMFTNNIYKLNKIFYLDYIKCASDLQLA